MNIAEEMGFVKEGNVMRVTLHNVILFMLFKYFSTTFG